MPTYKNVTTVRKMINSKVVEPGAEICSPVYYNENEVGLLKKSDFPTYNPVLYSDKIDKETEIKVPEKDNLGNLIGKYGLHFYVAKGEATISFNNPKNTPPLHLYKEARWNIRCFERTIDSLFVSSKEPFELFLIIEKL